jgi:hypothetical protein
MIISKITGSKAKLRGMDVSLAVLEGTFGAGVDI